MKMKKNILVALSGGVDSSVAAALLVKEGYTVTGAYMVNYEDDTDLAECWRPDYRDAVRVAAHLGIKLIRLNFVKEYKDAVLDYMYAEYKKGRTPNPDVLCNKFVKFDAWVKRAKELGFDAIATGHYATLSQNMEHGTQSSISEQLLCVPKDTNKDQTYFLHQLNQEQLSFAMFPLGSYTKDEVRKLAREFDLPTAEKEESMGICFVGEVPMTEFLQNKIKKTPGDIVLSSTGEVIGQHEGLPFYTIGQRNIGVSGGASKPLFVVEKDTENNALVVGDENDPKLYKKEIEIENMHWIGKEPDLPFQCQIRLRHRQALQWANVKKSTMKDSSCVVVEFVEPQRAVTPGQFAVLYTNGICLGGGAVQ